MTFSETNASDQPIAVLTGPSAFLVSQDGSAIWGFHLASKRRRRLMRSHSRRRTRAGRRSSPVSLTLNRQPGTGYECGALSNLSGTFTVTDEFDPQGDTATFTFAAPPSSQLVTSLTTDQSVYQLGQPIQLTSRRPMSAPSPSRSWSAPRRSTSSKVAPRSGTPTSPIRPGVIVSRRSNRANPSRRRPHGTACRNICRPACRRGHSSSPTSWIPDGNQATFQIVAPSDAQPIISLTTDQSVYEYGEPVQPPSPRPTREISRSRSSPGPRHSTSRVTAIPSWVWSSRISFPPNRAGRRCSRDSRIPRHTPGRIRRYRVILSLPITWDRQIPRRRSRSSARSLRPRNPFRRPLRSRSCPS